MRTPPILKTLALTATVVGTPSAVQASTQQTTMGVSMTVQAGCTVAAGSLSFGTQTSLQSNVDQSGSVSVTCTNTTPYSVGLDQGANGASVTARRMKGGTSNTEFVSYSLFTTSGRSANWGNTVGTDTVAGTGNGSAQTVTIFGRVPPQTIGSPGGYADTVNVTITY